MCVDGVRIAGTALWEQLVSVVSVPYPRLNQVLMSSSGAAFGPEIKVKGTKGHLHAEKNPTPSLFG